MKKTAILVVAIFAITMVVFFIAQKQAIQEEVQANQRLQKTTESLHEKILSQEDELTLTTGELSETRAQLLKIETQLKDLMVEKGVLENTIKNLEVEKMELSAELSVTKMKRPTFPCTLLKVDSYRNTVALDYGLSKGAQLDQLLRVILTDRTIDLKITDIRPDFCIAVVQSTNKLPDNLVNDTYISIYISDE